MVAGCYFDQLKMYLKNARVFFRGPCDEKQFQNPILSLYHRIETEAYIDYII
jgi:hypothetical protein